MFNLALAVCLIGLLVWFLFTRQNLSDGWAAELGKWMFIIGLAAVLFVAGKEVLF